MEKQMNPHYESDKLREEIDNIYEYLEELTGERHLLEEEMANMDEDEGEYPMDTEEEIEVYRKSVKNDPFWCAMYRHIKLTDKIDSLIVKAQQLQLEYVDATKKEFSEVEFEAKIAKRLKKVNLKELLLKMNC